MKRTYLEITILIIIFTVFAFVISRKVLNTPENLVGSDRDEHGCITSAGYSWCELKLKCLRVWEETCEDEKEIIRDVIDRYYKEYGSCLKDPPEEAMGMVSVYCQKNAGLISSNFIENIAKGGVAKAGADPVVCAQDFPESIKVIPDIQTDKDSAKGKVEEKFGTKFIETEVIMVREYTHWKIDNIICPQP